MARTGIHSFAKLRAQICNAATEKIVVPRTAIVRGPNLRADCHRPQLPAGFILGLRAGVGNPQHDRELIAKYKFLLWQSAVLERGV
jgi:hypothetical protein